MRLDAAKKYLYPKWKEGGVNQKHLDYFKFSDPYKQRDFERELIKDYINEKEFLATETLVALLPVISFLPLSVSITSSFV